MSGAPPAQPGRPPGPAPHPAGLLAALPDAVVLIRPDGAVHWANRAAERIFGRPFEEADRISAIDLVHPQDLEFALRSLASVQDKAVGAPIEVRVRTPDDSWQLVELVGTPVGWPEEGSVLLSARDLTDRRRFEMARDEMARFRSLVHNSAAVTMLVSPNGDIEAVSGALTRVLGHDPELVEGRHLAELVAGFDRDRVSGAMAQASQDAPGDAPVTVGVQMLRYDSAETIPFELSRS